MTLEVLTEIPDSIHVQKNETIVSYGYECHPSGIQFRRPVSLVIPHCAVLGDPRKVKTALYSWNDLSKGAIRYPHKKIKCKVSKFDLTLNLEHFSGGFLAFLKKRDVKGKLMSCMPYLPNTMPSSREPVLEVRLVNKPHGMQWEEIHEHGDDKRPVKGTDDEVFVKWRDMTVSCQLDEDEEQSKTVSHRSLRHKTKYTVYFLLNFCAGHKFNRNVTLTLEQKYKDTIIFPTTFEEPPSQVRSFQEYSAQPPRASTSSQRDDHSQPMIEQAEKDDTETSSRNERNVMPGTMATSSSIKKDPGARPKTRTVKRDSGSSEKLSSCASSASSSAVGYFEGTTGVTEGVIFNLSEKLGNHRNLRKLALALGFGIDQWNLYRASNTRRDDIVCSEGTFQMLCDWKMKTPKGEQRPSLVAALKDAGFAELVDVFFQDTFPHTCRN